MAVSEGSLVQTLARSELRNVIEQDDREGLAEYEDEILQDLQHDSGLISLCVHYGSHQCLDWMLEKSGYPRQTTRRLRSSGAPREDIDPLESPFLHQAAQAGSREVTEVLLRHRAQMQDVGYVAHLKRPKYKASLYGNAIAAAAWHLAPEVLRSMSDRFGQHAAAARLGADLAQQKAELRPVGTDPFPPGARKEFAFAVVPPMLLCCQAAGLSTDKSAANESAASVVRILLDMKASHAVQDHKGDTPLHLASRSGLQSVVGELLQSRADPLSRNLDGEAPETVAVRARQVDVASMLHEATAAQHAEGDSLLEAEEAERDRLARKKQKEKQKKQKQKEKKKQEKTGSPPAVSPTHGPRSPQPSATPEDADSGSDVSADESPQTLKIVSNGMRTGIPAATSKVAEDKITKKLQDLQRQIAAEKQQTAALTVEVKSLRKKLQSEAADKAALQRAIEDGLLREERMETELSLIRRSHTPEVPEHILQEMADSADRIAELEHQLAAQAANTPTPQASTVRQDTVFQERLLADHKDNLQRLVEVEMHLQALAGGTRIVPHLEELIDIEDWESWEKGVKAAAQTHLLQERARMEEKKRELLAFVNAQLGEKDEELERVTALNRSLKSGAITKLVGSCPSAEMSHAKLLEAESTLEELLSHVRSLSDK